MYNSVWTVILLERYAKIAEKIIIIFLKSITGLLLFPFLCLSVAEKMKNVYNYFLKFMIGLLIFMFVCTSSDFCGGIEGLRQDNEHIVTSYKLL